MRKKWITTDNLWPYGILVTMAVFVAWMLAVVTVAVEHHPQLTSDNYYAEGFNLKQLNARQAASNSTGWAVVVRSLPVEQAQMPLAELTVTEHSGSPCDSLKGEVAFYRPSDKSIDIESAAFFPVGAGKYMVKLPRPLEHGSWQAVAHLARGAQNADLRVPFFVE